MRPHHAAPPLRALRPSAMPPSQPLPFSPKFSSAEEYITSLLEFAEDPLFRILCGGVHILDFFTRDVSASDTSSDEPRDLYSAIVPAEWRSYFEAHHIDDILDVLMRTPIDQLPSDVPQSLATFIRKTRDHSLRREFTRKANSTDTMERKSQGMEWALNAGMRPKKVHEVENFSAFVDSLVRDIDSSLDVANDTTNGAANGADIAVDNGKISHILDYGSGQAYLSRMLAKKYGHNLIGLESRASNIAGAQDMDQRFDHLFAKKHKHWEKRINDRGSNEPPPEAPAAGTLEYIETHVSNGSLSPLLSTQHTNLLLISLHSCGNLIHHALTAFASTPAVRAVALIGCCYNLLTEKAGETFKTPQLRSAHPRLTTTGMACDPNGFPLSRRLEDGGMKLNITARSMACQAPANWTRESSADFFQRHFFRALLQRILLDRGIISEEPIVIGSLRKASYLSFHAYVTAAISKLGWEERITVIKEQAAEYQRDFEGRRKHLSVVWALMAFTAGVVESVIVVDRWVYLMEMGCRRAWVEAAFEYGESPRNLVVVGVR